jgi:hypothetical protein
VLQGEEHVSSTLNLSLLIALAVLEQDNLDIVQKKTF